MAGRIPQEFIDELMNRVDIVEVIDARVPLKKAGREYVACCPFHNEKTPSFTVSSTKQFYHCFGCGAHGTALGFLIEYEHMDFVEAVETLAAQVGLDVPRVAGAARGGSDQHPDLYAITAEADQFFRRQLRHHPQAQRAVDYLKGRGLSGEIAQRYGIGYAPPGWDTLLRTLGDSIERQELLVSAGLLIRKDDNKRYDRFRDRVMFPIRDRRGRTIAFGGRVIGEDTPKYLNSPETPIFHKGRELYGLWEARQALREIPRLLVVEGYMDVVALAQFGINNAVATLGTATTAEHLERLFRITSEVVFCFDGDRAGREAGWRALQQALPALREGRQIRFMFLPEGEDPDTLVRAQGSDAFVDRIAGAVPFSNFFFETLSKQTDTSSIDGRAKLVELARPFLNQLPEGVFRQMMFARLAELAHVPGGSLETTPRRETPPKGRLGRSGGRRIQMAKQPPSPVRTAITLLLHEPGLAALADDPRRFAELDLAGIDLLVEMIELLHSRPNLGSGALLEHWRDTEHASHLHRLATWQSPASDADLRAEFMGAIHSLDERLEKRGYAERLARYEALFRKSKDGTLSPAEAEEYTKLLGQLKH
ncbi:MAG: DNA primase [Thiotrichales bacterium SG8_50]|nr:MAG: DNA primase [Thiotrichales bacterium SG8_50]